MMIKTILTFMLLAIIGISNASQYIISFSNNQNFLMIDIGSGDMVYNVTIPRYYTVNYVSSVDYQTTTVSFFGSYITMKGIDYIVIDYDWSSNSFSNKSKPIAMGRTPFEYLDQPFQIVNNKYYIPTYAVSNLTIGCFDFNSINYESVTYGVPNYNETIPTIGAYSPITNKYYSLYYTTNQTPTIVSIDIPLVQDNSGNQFYNLPNSSENGMPFSIGMGTLFVKTTGELLFVERYLTNITVYEINLETLDAQVKYVTPIDYTYDFPDHFLSTDNQYLIVMNGPTYTNPNASITYSFVDTTTWDQAYSFTTSNYFNNPSDIHSNAFYFDGQF